jgi:hypothetical protein
MDPIGRIRSILSNYVSPITGEALIAAALRRLRPGVHDFSAQNLERIVGALDRGIDLFVAEERRAALRAELAALTPAVPAPLALEIKGEADVERARALASGLCERLGARPSSTWKVASGVVALASRLAERPLPGQIEVIPLSDSPRGVRVRATDREIPAARSSGQTVPPPRPSSHAPVSPTASPASRPAPPASPSGVLDGALPTIRRVADRFDVRGVGNRTHVEFDVWFSKIQRPR